MKSVCIAVFALAAALSLAVGGQEGGDAVAADSPSEILDRAAAVQGGETILADLRSFEVAFNLEVFDPDKGRGNFEVERLFAYEDSGGGESGVMLTRKRRSDTSAPFTTMVYNGEDAWRIGEDGEITIFTDRPSAFRTDIDNILDDVRLTAQMLRFFFIKTIAGALEDAELQSQRQIEGVSCYVLSGTATAWLGGDSDTRVHIRIAIDREALVVREVRITDLAQSDERRIFRFDRYYHNAQGVLVPCQIKIYSSDEERFDMQIAVKVKTVEEEHADGAKTKTRVPSIAFNVPVAAEVFAVPETK